MAINFRICLLVFFSMVILTDCKHEIPELPVQPSRVTKSDTCRLDTVYFVNDILPILLSNCSQSGCHDAFTREGIIQLTDYDNVIKAGEVKAGRPDDSKLYEVLLETDPKKLMPPPPASLTPEQKNAIRLWISQGALNNMCISACDTSNVTFSNIIWPILVSTCQGCHTFPNGKAGVNMRGYDDIKELVDNGKLDGVINHRVGFKPMPPPPGEVEKCAKDQIRIWIDAGAPNN